MTAQACARDVGILLADRLAEAAGVVHVGAGTGQEAAFYHAHGVPVLWVEAVPEIYDVLRRNISLYQHQRAVLACCDDSAASIVDFHVASHSGSSSLYQFGRHRVIWPDIEMVRTIRLRPYTLDQIVIADGGRYDVLVLDVQGAELRVLRGACRTLHCFRYIVLEADDCGLYTDAPSVDAIERYLETAGWKEVDRTVMEATQKGGCYNILYERVPA